MSGNLTFLGDANNDLYIDNTGNLAMASGLDGLIDTCKCILEAQLREMIYAYDQGMPTLDTVFRQLNLAQYIAVGRSRLMTVDGVVSVQLFVASVANNQMNYTAKILSIYSSSLVSITNQGV
jgi:hypothetical protein